MNYFLPVRVTNLGSFYRFALITPCCQQIPQRHVTMEQARNLRFLQQADFHFFRLTCPNCDQRHPRYRGRLSVQGKLDNLPLRQLEMWWEQAGYPTLEASVAVVEAMENLIDLPPQESIVILNCKL